MMNKISPDVQAALMHFGLNEDSDPMDKAKAVVSYHFGEGWFGSLLYWFQQCGVQVVPVEQEELEFAETTPVITSKAEIGMALSELQEAFFTVCNSYEDTAKQLLYVKGIPINSQKVIDIENLMGNNRRNFTMMLYGIASKIDS